MDKGIRNNVFFIIGLIVAAAVAVGLALAAMGTAVQSSPTVPNPTVKTQAAPEAGVELPLVQLSGEWTAERNGSKFVATVENDVINIALVSGDTSMNYWNGTFKTTAENGEVINSTKVEMDEMIMSQSTAKDFTVEDGKIAFEFKAMGMTTIVRLTHV